MQSAIISVVILTNERPAATFERAYRSAIVQTFSPSKVVIIDTGSD